MMISLACAPLKHAPQNSKITSLSELDFATRWLFSADSVATIQQKKGQ